MYLSFGQKKQLNSCYWILRMASVSLRVYSGKHIVINAKPLRLMSMLSMKFEFFIRLTGRWNSNGTLMTFEIDDSIIGRRVSYWWMIDDSFLKRVCEHRGKKVVSLIYKSLVYRSAFFATIPISHVLYTAKVHSQSSIVLSIL